MATSGGPKIKTDGLVFGFDTGYPLVGSGNDTTYKFNKGAPVFNIARAMTSWPTKARVTVSLYTGSIQPPIPGEAIYKLVCNADNAGILCRDGGYYYGGGYAGSGNPSNANILSDRENEYTPLGNNKFVYSLYVRPTENTLDTTAAYIDIGDKNSVNVQNVDDLTDWHKLETTDAIQINNTAYPYDFIDFAYGPNTIGNELLVSAIQFLRTPGNDSGSLKTPSPGTQYLTYDAERSFSGSLIDLTRTTDIDLSNVSFDSNAQMTFDGTDDSILLTPRVQYSTGSAWTAELIFEPTTTDSWNGIFGGHLNAGGYWMFHSAQNLTYYEGSSAESGTRISYKSWSIGNTFTLNQDHHLTITYTPTTAGSGSFALYYNGGEKVDTFDYGFYWAHSLDMKKIGSGDSSRYGTNNIKIFKFYNIALSAEEVKQNYNAIKSRFGLT